MTQRGTLSLHVFWGRGIPQCHLEASQLYMVLAVITDRHRDVQTQSTHYKKPPSAVCQYYYLYTALASLRTFNVAPLANLARLHSTT